jgi:hypothetical protein
MLSDQRAPSHIFTPAKLGAFGPQLPSRYSRGRILKIVP